MTFINLTPHTVRVYSEIGETVLFEEGPSGTVARVKEEVEVKSMLGSIPVVHKTYTEVLDLPEPKKYTTYIVSVLVLNALNGTRNDVMCPDTGTDSVVRDDKGHILGVKRLQQ